ncbi:type III pantothenate kinase [bacterium]|nr:type III pantothenate kinase [bacterium]
MLLAIDVGNTNIVVALFNDDGGIHAQWRIATHRYQTADEFMLTLEGLFRLKGIAYGSVTHAIAASVVPMLNGTVKEAVKKLCHVMCRMVGDESLPIDMPVDLRNPQELGADRLVNAFAARETFGPNLIVLDLGTATTFDVVDMRGHYVGGIIAPGPNISLKALHDAAAKLPSVNFAKPRDGVVGKDTVGAMQSGIYYGYACMIGGLIEKLRADMGEPTVLATGGLATLIMDEVKSIQHHVPDLTMQGLWMIHKAAA